MSCKKCNSLLILILAALGVIVFAQHSFAAPLAAGASHSSAIRSDGSLWSWGYNGYGHLGDGTTSNRYYPVSIATGTTWTAVAAGGYHTVAIKESDGSLWAWGYNGYGQLGDGTTVSNSTKYSPVSIATGSTWTTVAAGGLDYYGYTVAIKDDGSLWAWGYNGYGQLGIGSTPTSTNAPALVSAGTWTAVAAGQYHTVALDSDRNLWAWGRNNNGQLGIGSDQASTSFPVSVATGTTWTAVAAGGYHTVAIKESDGSLWAWGPHVNGRLGNGSTSGFSYYPVQIEPGKSWIAVAAGAAHTVAIDTDRRLWAWGYNNYGQLGDGTLASKSTPTTIGEDTDWVAVAAGGNHSTAMKADGSLWTWGYNNNGQIGDGSTTKSSTPVLIAPDISATPSAADFGNVRTETQSSSYTFSISNTGEFDLVVGAITLTGTGAAEFSKLNDACSNQTLAPTSNCIVNVAFTPASAGSKTAALSIPSNDPYSPTRDISLTGSGTDYKLTIAKTGMGRVAGEGVDCGFDCTEGLISGVTLTAIPEPGFVFADWTGGGCEGMDTCTISSFSSDVTVTAQFTAPVVAATSIAAGGSHSLALRTDGSLWAWGYNYYGQLGDNTYTARSTPVSIGMDADWAVIAAGDHHSVAVKSDGTLWAWGYNGYGQLGDGTLTPRSTPTMIGTDTNWTAVAAGFNHTVAIKSDGTLWAWGRNNYGQLGDDSTTQQNTPVMIGSDTNWAAVAAGKYHSLALKSDGSLWAWGYNDYGQLGDATATERDVPTRVGSDTDWAEVTAGYSHSLALKKDGTLLAWGYNGYGQLGNNSTSSQSAPVSIATGTSWTAIAGGGYYTVAIKDDGTLWAWGRNNYGQLGDGTTTQRTAPVWIGTAVDWAEIAAGGSHTLALTTDGTLWAWGYNGNDQLGDGSGLQRYAPVTLSQNISVAPLSRDFGNIKLGTQSVYSFQVKNAGSFELAVSPISAPTNTEFSIIGDLCSNQTLTPGYSCALKVAFTPASTGSRNATLTISSSDLDSPVVNIPLSGTGTAAALTVEKTGMGRVTGEGIDCGFDCTEGLISTVTLTATPSPGFTFDGWLSSACSGTSVCTVSSISPDVTVTAQFTPSFAATAAIAAGYYHSVIIKTDGTLWAWGSNSSGCLGDGTTTNRSTPVMIGTDTDWIAVAAGYNHTAAIKTDGSLWAWGDNGYGQLGDGTTSDKHYPTRIGTDADWAAVAAGSNHTIAVKTDGTLWAWGSNNYGQLGDNTTNNRLTPVLVGTDDTWVAVSAGQYHMLALKSDGTLWTWGYNSNGQLGDGATTTRYTPAMIGSDTDWSAVSAGDIHSLALKTDGTLWAWGNNGNGRLGLGDSSQRTSPTQVGVDSNWATVTAGGSHTLALKSNRTLLTWGYNGYGQLGDGSSGYGTDKTTPSAIGADNDWASIAAGTSHTMALKTDGSLWTWGYNYQGQIGDDTALQRNDPVVLAQNISVAPSSRNFGNIKVETQSVYSFQVKNKGSFELAISTISAPTNTEFSIVSDLCSNQTLTPGYSCEVKMAFLPASLGAKYATLTISSNDIDTSIINVPLSGTGTAYSLTVAKEGMGTITGPGINCGFDCTEGLSSGQTYTLTATPAPGFTFSDWDGCETVVGGECVLSSLAPDITVTAQFTAPVVATSVIAAGKENYSHSIAIRTDGTLWAWGYDGYGQLGVGGSSSPNYRITPVQVGVASNWAAVAAGDSHTIALKTDGSLWAWGRNYYGQLGDGTTTQRTSPMRIGTDTDWVAVAAGGSHTAALKKDGTLWTWGYNYYGQLGDNSTTQRNAPVMIGSDADWVAISAGESHTLALKSDGTLWAWGYNSSSRLGDGTTNTRYTPTRIGSATNWTAIAAGKDHSLAIDADKRLWGWGYNNYGQLGDGTLSSRSTPTTIGEDATWAAVFAGGADYGHSIAVKTDGTLWAWGLNSYGQLGDGTTTKSTTPIQIGANTIGIWATAAAGGNHSMALKSDGSLWSWGYNGNGQLGDYSAISRNVPVPLAHSIAVTPESRDFGNIKTGAQVVYAFHVKNTGSFDLAIDTIASTGTNSSEFEIQSDLCSGQTLTADDSCVIKVGFTPAATGSRSATLSIPSNDPGSPTVSIPLTGTGTAYTLSVAKDGMGTITGPGINCGFDCTEGLSSSQTYTLTATPATGFVFEAWSGDCTAEGNECILSSLSLNVTVTAQFTPLVVATSSIAAGEFHSIALKTNGTLWSWGYNNYGQLGDGSTSSRTAPVQIGSDADWMTVAAGYSHNLALKTDGSLWAWGGGTSGKLGIGTTSSKYSPVRVGSDSDWVAIAAGSAHSLALKADGTLWAWGGNDSGQLGDDTTFSRYEPVLIGHDVGWVAIAAGDSYSAALKSDGTLWTWGANSYGVLGIGDSTTTPRYVPVQVGEVSDWAAVSAGNFHALALVSNGALRAWGYNNAGELGDGSVASKSTPTVVGADADWSAVSAGNAHSMALKMDGSLWAWGYNYYGELGDGTVVSKSTPTMIGSDTDWAAVAAGGTHTLALKTDGTLWAWGRNNYGQLGDGTTTQRTAPAGLILVSTSPANGAVDVPVSTVVTASFSDEMNPATIQSPASTFILVSAASGTVSGSVAYNQTGNTATFTPSNTLGFNDTITATLTAGITDTAGNPLPSNISWSFTTAYQVAVSCSPGTNLGSVPVSSSVSASCTLTNTGTSSLTMGTLSLSGSSDFAKSTDACSGQTLAASGTCGFQIVFTPTAGTSRSTTLSGITDRPSMTFTGTGLGYALTADTSGSSGQGIIQSAPAGINCGYQGSSCSASFALSSQVTLTALPQEGSAFTGWSGACSGTSQCVVTMDAAKTVKATFISSATLGGVPEEGSLQVTVQNDGSIGVTRFISGAWQNQIFGWDSKGSRLQLLTNGTTTVSYSLGYYSGTAATLVSNEKVAADHIESQWTADGTAVHFDLTYQPGDAYYSLKWTLLNQSGGTLTDLRFFHGEDTYFFNSDNGAGYWDAANNTIGVQKTVSGQLMRMSLKSVTPPYAYDSENYSTVRSKVNAGALDNTINSSEGTDNGYALEWRTDSLANGETWTIMAYEKFADVNIGGVSVTAPILTDCLAGTACDLTYTVHNISGVDTTVTLDAAIDLAGWLATVQSPLSSAVTITAGGSQPVVIRVSVPSGADSGTVAQVTLTADDGETAASDTGSVRATIPQTFLITSSTGTGGNISPLGETAVISGDTQVYYITPDASYGVADVLVDGVSVGVVTTYTFTDVISAHTITASFAPLLHTITPTSMPGGYVYPSELVNVEHGASRTFTLWPNPGYYVSAVTSNGVSVLDQVVDNAITLNGVITDVALAVEFSKAGLPFIGLETDNQGSAAWNADGSGSEPVATGHAIPSPYSTCLVNAYYYLASRDYVDSAPTDSMGALHFIGPVGGFPNFMAALSDGGYDLSDVTMRFDLMSLGTDSDGQDWFFDGNIETRYYKGQGSLMIRYQGQDLLGGPLPVFRVKVNYNDAYNCDDDQISGDTGYVMLKDVYEGADPAVRSMTEALLGDVGGMGVKLNFDSMQPAGQQYEVSGNGRSGAFFEAQSGSMGLSPISISPTLHAFGGVTISETSGAVDFTIYNNDISDIALGTIQLAGTDPGEFQIQENSCVSELASMTTCTVRVVFSPQTSGARSSLLNVPFEAPNAEALNVSLSGTGVLPAPYTITATTGLHGTIEPSGELTVNYGDNATFNMFPGTGYHVLNVLVDGESVGAAATYTFSNVVSNHSISASFAINTYTITASAGQNGTITPPGPTVTVNHGSNATFEIAPVAGNHIVDVLVDNASVGPVELYTFPTVTANHTISATFAPDTVTAFSSVSPAQNAVVSTATVGYTLNKAITSGSVKFERTGGAADTSHTYTFVAADLTEGTHSIATGLPLVDGAIYRVTFTGVDGENTISASSNTVTFDARTILAIDSPQSNSIINAASVGYTLSEAVSSGRITINRTDGSSDTAAPHTYNFLSSDMTATSHKVDTGAILINGAVYTITIDNVRDLESNLTTSVSVITITYDAQAVAITNTRPAKKSIITSAAVSYTFSEKALSGKVTFTRTGGTADPGSPHKYDLSGAHLDAGDHAVSTGLPLVNGAFYTVSFEATDLAGNPATTVSNALVFFDGNFGKGPVGDVANEDGLNVVNDADVAKLKSAMGGRPGDANWNPAADLDRNNVIDQKDLMIMLQHFGK